jgi:hypothetical protein
MSLQEFRQQVELAEWIQQHFSRSYPVDKKGNLALACFDLAIEHHAAICVLHSSGLYGSLYALLQSNLRHMGVAFG